MGKNLLAALDEFESREIRQALRVSKGNMALAAKYLGLKRHPFTCRAMRLERLGHGTLSKDLGERESLGIILDRAERDAIQEVLDETGCDLRKAAELLGCTSTTLRRKMDRLKLSETASSEEAFRQSRDRWVHSFERDYIVSLLKKNGGDKQKAAKEAEMPFEKLDELIRKYDIR
jgi:transcriptional regulator with GAF, ATPase, and Fis domain